VSTFADPQTLSDLNIPGSHRSRSVAWLFDTVVTDGGRRLMESMFRHPLTDAEDINRRSDIFRYFAGQSASLPFSGEDFESVESYLTSGGGSLLGTSIGAASMRVAQVAVNDPGYAELQGAVRTTLELLGRFEAFIAELADGGGPCAESIEQARRTLAHPALAARQWQGGATDLPLFTLIRYDHLLRTRLRESLVQLIELMVQLDVYIAVANVGKARGFSYARALPEAANRLSVTNLRHPTLDNAVGNSLSFHTDTNAIFLTGANMAGKSTLMKSFGICVYLAHMGFPVAASDMEFSVKDGLYTSINVPDDLALGYSHFYAEVLRVKAVAEEVAAGKGLVVVFDELFKGTNVKDAYDATLSLTEALADHRDSFFVISTHIIEVGEALGERCGNFLFTFLPTVMDGVTPRYTYELAPGITRDRQGMTIIENERLIELIRAGETRRIPRGS
jgi:DNA mismatch repair protein MutS